MKTIRKYLAKIIGTTGTFLLGVALVIEFGMERTLDGLETLKEAILEKKKQLENPPS